MNYSTLVYDVFSEFLRVKNVEKDDIVIGKLSLKDYNKILK